MTSHVAKDAIQAAVEQLHRLGIGSTLFTAHVRQVAARFNVDERTVYRWVASQPSLPATEPITSASFDEEANDIIAAHEAMMLETASDSPRQGGRFEIDSLHLTVYAHCRDGHTAWRTLHDKGLVDVSYPTFMRALSRANPALVAGALEGFPGVVRNRQYLQYRAPHRNHTFHADHTPADVWVLPDHRTTSAIRPHVTVVTDGYSGLVSAFLWASHPTGEDVAAALAETASRRDYCGVTIGGIPEQLVVDNGAENLAGIITAGARQLGWIVAPVVPYSSWQNGKAERAIQLVNNGLSNRAPGAIHGGKTRDNKRWFAAASMNKVDPERLWTMDTLRAALNEVVDHINTELPVRRLGGMTRLQAYAADPTEQRFVSPVELRSAMLSTAKRTYRATKNGIHFDKGQYVAAGLHVGRSYRIRHLPHGRDFIEVFTEDEEHVTTAWRVDRIPEQERFRLLAERGRVERDAKAIATGVIQWRDRVAAAGNALTALADDSDAPIDVVVPPERVKPPRAKRKRRSRATEPQPPVAEADGLDVTGLTELFGDTLPAEYHETGGHP